VSEPYVVVVDDTSTLSRPEWLALRRLGIGSSDAAAAMSMSPWQSAYGLHCEKRGLVPGQEGNERMEWGNLLEGVILAEAVKRGWLVGPVHRHLMLRSVEYPWMQTNPDALTAAAVGEAKNMDGWDEARWDEGVPDHYAIQAHHHMIVTGRRVCEFPVLFGGNHLRLFTVKWDEALAQTVIDGTLHAWERIQDDTPPDPDGSEASMLALRAVFTEYEGGKGLELDSEQVTWVDDRTFFEELAKKNHAEGEIRKALLMDLLGNADAEFGTLNGQPIVTWKADKNGKRTMRFPEYKELYG
jgi:putative phage-type endonuclease